MLSPVWLDMITDLKRTGPTVKLDLGAKESPAVFAKLVDAAVGAEVELPGGMEELLAIGGMAGRCLMSDVWPVIERECMARLDVQSCARILTCTHGTEMRELAGAARELALHSFCKFAEGPGFADLPAEALLPLLEDDALVSEEGEDAVLAAVLAWAGARPTLQRAEEAGRLLRAVRLRFVRPGYAESAMARAPNELLPHLREALAAAALGTARGIQEAAEAKERGSAPDDGQAADSHTDARGPGGSQLEEGTRPLRGFFTSEERVPLGTFVYTLAASGGDLFAAVEGGAIQAWDMATLTLKRTLRGHTAVARALVAHAGWLISGSDDETICVWDVATGERLAGLCSHRGKCRALAVCGGFLASGHFHLDNFDGGVSFWRMRGDPSQWEGQEYFAEGSYGKDVHCLAAVGGGLVAAGYNRDVWVYRAETGQQVAGPLREDCSFNSGPFSAVTALAVAGRRLYIASRDSPVLAFSIDTWAEVGKGAAAQPADGSQQNERSLLPLGRALVTGASGPRYSATARYEVRVLDARTLAVLDVLPQGPGENILSLIAAGGCVWGAAGDKLVAWRRGASGVPRAEFVARGPRRYQPEVVDSEASNLKLEAGCSGA
jgi:hypothetical protein